MSGWLYNVIVSEFLWGVVLGIGLSVLAARLGIHFQNVEHVRRVKNFSADLVQNLKDYAKALDEHRDRNGVIYEDYLALIETEIGLWGRNREHMILISPEKRKALRDYLARAAKSAVEVRIYLNRFNEAMQKAGQAGPTAAADAYRVDANSNLNLAREKADRLISHINQGFSEKQVADLLA